MVKAEVGHFSPSFNYFLEPIPANEFAGLLMEAVVGERLEVDLQKLTIEDFAERLSVLLMDFKF